MPNTKKIADLFEPMYKDFQENTESLFASFSLTELNTLERYFLKAMEIMNNKIASITVKK